jgi:hypothetical protein
MDRGGQQDAPLSKMLHFVRSIGLLRGRNRKGRIINQGSRGAKAGFLSFIQPYTPSLTLGLMVEGLHF